MSHGRAELPGPRWSRLYAGLVAIFAAGTAGHAIFRNPRVIAGLDAGVAAIVVTVLVVWVRVNRVRLARLDDFD